ncbi:uncharacterized protein LOC117167072 [Belonocnema kinseyi]|uniref:uncharacterized protein LOC117167072 n=1 Tax=Belonocnema kinseyi TaxID=2817044 RepID=UPI00143DD790|nr:uncharacterized protein LOC117167072 [Belonocnema kinseyi]XP_033207568.1 uncharacterized protein LOC117167072 [Belonocnema kinseyi]XP_033207569.1 uncharacterized protein LOC117167072 [Belonocnema kinseyi]XP_033207570.1 uncharacterized protein LOC117167072 [Belonocnema kinseyi]
MVVTEFLYTIGTLFLAGIFTFVLIPVKNEDPIFGVYKQPGKWYWAKYLGIYLMLKTRQILGYIDRKRSHRTGYGLKSRSTIEEMDMPQILSPHPKAFDAVFFMGVSKDGFYMIGGTERRQDGVVNGLFYLLVPGVGLFRSEKLPNTLLNGTEEKVFAAEGIRFTPIEPMKEWKVEFDGKMNYTPVLKPNDGSSTICKSKVAQVVFHGEWKSDLAYFDFDTDMATETTCRALAREDWTKEYFNNLREAHQTHYEQMGRINAKLSIDGKPYEFNGQAFRDHSYGLKRDWKLMHRYIFHMLFLEDGTMASIGMISQPCTCSRLEAGCVYEPDGSLHAVEKCDLELYQHGEHGTPPRDYAFTIEAGNKTYNVQIDVVEEAIHFVGNNEDARMVERFIKYQVNGKINGRGISEFHYNNENYQRLQRANNPSPSL